MGNFFQFQQFVIGDDTSGKAWHNLLQGISIQQSPAMDASMNNNVLDFLFCDDEHGQCHIPGGFGQDLGARNIQRGRDHGIPGYNKYREYCKLEKIESLTEDGRPSNINIKNWKNILRAYQNGNVDDIDLFVGGLAETSLPRALVGETFACILGEQFQKLKEGDRFFFTLHSNFGGDHTKGLPPNLKKFVRDRSLGNILCQHTDMATVPAEVMLLGGEETPCPSIASQMDSLRRDVLENICIEERTDFNQPGKDIGYVGEIDSSLTCACRCREKAGCKFFTWNAASNLCILKATDDGRRSHSVAFSGRADCCVEDLLTDGNQLLPTEVFQSSTHPCSKPDICGAAQRCIDSNITTFCHTKTDDAPWFALNFSVPVVVTKVDIYSASWARVGDLEVRVTNTLPTDGSTVFSGGELFGIYPSHERNFEGTPQRGMYVVLQRNSGQLPKDSLIMNEIWVFGYPSK